MLINQLLYFIKHLKKPLMFSTHGSLYQIKDKCYMLFVFEGKSVVVLFTFGLELRNHQRGGNLDALDQEICTRA